jgi:uncharacterized protein (DUF433 family)
MSRRRRWQIDLRPEDEATLMRARRALGADGDSETGRALLALFGRLAAAIESGSVVSFLPGDDPRAVDALPDVTGALRPEGHYRWLVAAPHPWRKQLSIKGRRMTAGQLVFSMEANGDSIEEAAEDWDLSAEAVAEAVEYVARNRELIEAEFAEERRRVEPFLTHRAPTPR